MNVNRRRKGYFEAIPFRKPFVKLLMAVKQSGHNEMKQGPKLCHIILNRGASQKQSIPTIKGEQCLPSLTTRRKETCKLMK